MSTEKITKKPRKQQITVIIFIYSSGLIHLSIENNNKYYNNMTRIQCLVSAFVCVPTLLTVVKASHIYYSALYNTNCIEAASQ